MKTLALLLILVTAQQAHAACDTNLKANTSTQHTTQIAGQTINYTATTGFIEVTGSDTTSKACVFYTSYTSASTAHRPITFAFNGGPGSSSVWLHLGLMGPERTDLGQDGLTPANQGLIKNEFSPLDVTDVVMIDPVGTGFSHAEAPGARQELLGSAQRLRFARFIRAKLRQREQSLGIAEISDRGELRRNARQPPCALLAGHIGHQPSWCDVHLASALGPRSQHRRPREQRCVLDVFSYVRDDGVVPSPHREQVSRSRRRHSLQ